MKTTLFICLVLLSIGIDTLSGWENIVSKSHDNGDFSYYIDVEHPSSKWYKSGSSVFYKGSSIKIRARKTEHDGLFSNYYIEAYDDPSDSPKKRFANRDSTNKKHSVGKSRTLSSARNTISVSGWRDRILEGNRERLSTRSRVFIRDNGVPSLSWVGALPSQGSIVRHAVSPQASAHDSGSGVASRTYSVYRGSSVQNRTRIYRGSGKPGSLGDGNYKVVFSAVDNVSNSSQISREFSIDRTKPAAGFWPDGLSVSSTSPASWSSLPEGGYELEISPDDPRVNSYASGIDEYSMRIFRRDASGSYIELYAEVNQDSSSMKAGLSHAGEYRIELMAADKAGNSIRQEYFAAIDDSPPELAVEWPGPSDLSHAWFRDDVGISAAVEDHHAGAAANSIEYSLNGMEWMPGSSILIHEEGSYTLRLRAGDAVGNMTMQTISFGIDRGSPQTSVDDLLSSSGWSAEQLPPETAPWVSSAEGVKLRLTAEDPDLQDGTVGSGIHNGSWRYQLPGGGKRRFSSHEPELQILHNGKTPVHVCVQDNAGNQFEDTYYSYLDVTPPIITGIEYASEGNSGSLASIPAGAPYLSGLQQFAGIVQDDDSGVDTASIEWRLIYENGTLAGSGTGRTFEYDLADSADGFYALGFRMKDRAGNYSSQDWDAVPNHYFGIDTTAPEIRLLEPADSGEWSRGSNIRIAVVDEGIGAAPAAAEYANEPLSAEYRDGILTLDIPPTAATGTETVDVHTTDLLGNTAVHSIEIQIDRTPPDVQLIRASGETEAEWLNGPGGFLVHAADSHSGIAQIDWQWFTAKDPHLAMESSFNPAAGKPDEAVWKALQGADGSMTVGRAASSEPQDIDLFRYESGVYLAVITARDVLGNTTYAAEQLWIDSEPVILSAEVHGRWGETAGPHGWLSAEAAVIRVTASPGLSGLNPDSWTVQDQGGTAELHTGENPIEILLTEQGSHELKVSASSSAGVAGSLRQQVMLDCTPPELEITPYPYYDTELGGVWIQDFSAHDLHAGIAGSPLLLTDTDGTVLGASDHNIFQAGFDTDTWCFFPVSVEAADARIEADFVLHDAAGNSGTAAAAFLLDTAQPRITSLQLQDRDGNNATGTGAASVSKKMQATVFVEDRSSGSAEEAISGAVLGIEYRIGRDDPALSENTWQWVPVGNGKTIEQFQANAQLSFEVEVPHSGQWRMEYRAVDGARNKGETGHQVFWVDSEAPEIPVISSRTHPEGKQDLEAVPFSSAFFDISAGNALIPPREYRYELVRGYRSVGTFIQTHTERSGIVPVSADEDGFAALLLDDLDDNRLNEHYQLSITATGANGMESLPAVYGFRVDTSPPQELRLLSSTHADQQRWSKLAEVGLTWQQPADMSGIRRYYLRIDHHPDILPESSEDLREHEFSAEWQQIAVSGDRMSTAIALEDYGDYGELFAALVAEDYAGNRSVSRRIVRFDRSPPEYELHIDHDHDSLTVAAAWRDASDVNPEDGDRPSSGIDFVQVELFVEADGQLQSTGRKWRFSRTGQINAYEHSIQLQHNDTQYELRIRMVDHAGNCNEKRSRFSTGSAGHSPLVLPFVWEWEGFRIEGTYNETDSQLTAGQLQIPAAYRMRDHEGVETAGIPIADIHAELDSAGEIFLHSVELAADTPYHLQVAGWETELHRIQFVPGTGLVGTMGIIGPQDQQMSFPDTVVSPPPVVRFLGSGYTDSAHVGSLRTAGNTAAPGWLLELQNQARLQGDTVRFEPGTLLVGDGQVLSPENPVLEHLQLRAAEDGREYQLQTGSLHPGQNAAIRIHGLSYYLEHTVVSSDRLTVNKGYIELPPGWLPQRPQFRYASLTTDGKWIAEHGFYLEPVEYRDSDGRVFRLTDFHLHDGRLAAIAGSLAGSDQEGVASPGVSLSGLLITDEGIDWQNSEVHTGTMRRRIHGFDIDLYQVSIRMENGVPQAVIGLARPAAMPSGLPNPDEISLHELVFNLDDWTVLHPGIADIQFTLGAEISGYGRGIPADSLRLTDSGFYISELYVPAADQHILFSDVGVFRDGEIAPVEQRKQGYQLQLGDTRFTAEHWEFSSGILAACDGWAELPAYMHQDRMQFDRLVFHNGEVADSAQGFGRLEFSDSGYRHIVRKPFIDASGIFGTSELRLPEPFTGALEFVNSRLGDHVQLGAVSRSADGVSGRRLLHGYPVEITNAVLGKSRISLYDIQSTIPELLGGGNLHIPEIELVQGTALGEAELEQPLHLNALNGFSIIAEHLRVDSESMHLGGRILLPNGLGGGYVPVPNGSMQLGRDGRITTSVITYHDSLPVMRIGGFPVSIRAMQLQPDRWAFPQTSITLPQFGASVLLPGFAVCLENGRIEGEMRHVGLQLSHMGGNLEIVSAGITNDGLAAHLRVYMPWLSGLELDFNPVILLPDGGLRSPVTIPRITLPIPFTSGRVSLEDLRFTADGIESARVEARLPGILSGVTLFARHVRLQPQGGLQIGATGLEPFDLWGCRFFIADLQVQDEVISLYGNVRLSSLLPPGIAGREIAINDLRISTAGELLGLELHVPGRSVFPLFGDWRIAAEGLQVRQDESLKPVIEIPYAQLLFPPQMHAQGWRIPEVGITGVYIDLASGRGGIDSAEVAGLSAEYAGCDWNLTSVALSGDGEMQFSGSVVLTDPAMPDFLHGLQLEVQNLGIDADGRVQSLAAAVSGIQGEIAGGFRLHNAGVGMHMEGGELLISVSGGLLLAAPLPRGIAGMMLEIQELVIDSATGAIRRVSACAEQKALMVSIPGGSVDIENASVRLETKADTGLTLCIDGSAVLPAEFPGVLSSARVQLGEFRINEQGETAFSAAMLVAGDSVLTGDIRIASGTIALSCTYGEPALVGLSGQLYLGESFPKGLSGQRLDIGELKFTIDGKIHTVDIGIAQARAELAGIIIHDSVLEFAGDSRNELLIGIGGRAVLPEHLPQGLAGLSADIQTCRVDMHGRIIELDAAVDGIHAELFGGLKLTGGSMRFSAGEDNEVKADIAGSVTLPAHLPDGIAGTQLRIEDCSISSIHGVTAFSIASANPVRFPIFAGITAEITRVQIGTDGIRTHGLLHIPDDFPLDVSTVRMSSLHIDWSGQIQELNGGIGHAYISIGGFAAELRELAFHPDGIHIDVIDIELPDPFHRTQLQLHDAGFNRKGEFYGEAAVSSIQFEMAGFSVVLNNPTLEPRSREISFRNAEMILPEMLGGVRFSLYGLQIGAAGVRYSGGKLMLPDFTIAGGLGFRNVLVNLQLEGSNYRIEGGGEAVVPGMGAFAAEVAFVNRSPVYPWGLKRAFFSYTVSGLGLPIANTGMYIHSLNGGLAFGPPDELPDKVQYLFDTGTRIEAGIGMVDQTGGFAVAASGSVWIDISQWGIAVRGNAVVLSGVVRGEMLAAITGQGFYGSVQIELVYARGQVEVFIYPYNNAVQVSGSGRVQFGMRQGLLVDEELLGVRVQIPTSDIWLAEAGAEFGRFTSGKEGIRAYVEVPLLGETGVFLDRNGGFELGNVSQYELYRPQTSRNAQALHMVQPVRSTAAAILHRPNADAPSRLYAGLNTGNQAASHSGDDLQRLVFLILYTEGDPVLTAIDPSGNKFRDGDPQVAVQYFEWGAAVQIDNPVPGHWRIEVANLLDPDGYVIKAMGVHRSPDLKINPLPDEDIKANGLLEISGTARFVSAENDRIAVYLFDEQNHPGDRLLYENVIEPGPFMLQIPAEDIPSGNWQAAVVLHSGNNPQRREVAEGRIRITAEAATTISPVSDLIVVDRGGGRVELHFKHNGTRTAGYLLHIDNPVHGDVQEIDMGYLQILRLSGFPERTPLRFGIAPYRVSAAEPEEFVYAETVLGETRTGYAAPRIELPITPVMLEIGERIRVPVDISAGNGKVRQWGIAAEDGSSRLSLFSPAVISGESEYSNTAVTLAAGNAVPPGKYQVKIRVENLDDISAAAEGSFEVHVVYPELKVERMEPPVVTGSGEHQVTIFGSGFVGGIRVWAAETEQADDMTHSRELAVAGDNPDFRTLRLPADLGHATYQLVIQSPGGEVVGHNLTVERPHYRLHLYGDAVIGTPGETAALYVSAEPIHDFNGSGVVSLGAADSNPENSNIFPGDAGTFPVDMNTDTRIEFLIPGNIKPGSYQLRVAGEYGEAVSVPLIVQLPDSGSVADQTHIKLARPQSIYAGQELRLFGHRLQQIRTLHIGGTGQSIASRTDERLLLHADNRTASGYITAVLQDGSSIQGPWIEIRQRGFALRGPEEIVLTAGSSIEVEYTLTGYADEIALRCDLAGGVDLAGASYHAGGAGPTGGADPASSPDPSASSSPAGLVHASLSPDHAVPNAVINFRLQADQNAQPGSIPFTIRAESGGYSTALHGSIQLLPKMYMPRDQLPEGTVGRRYRTQIEVTGGSGTSRYETAGGRIPPGLQLHTDGTISGIPRESGRYMFEILVQDEQENELLQTVQMTVKSSEWSAHDMDSSRSRWNPVPVSGSPHLLWRSPAADLSGIRSMGSRIAVYGPSGLHVYDRDGGALLYHYPGAVEDMYAVDGIWLLQGENLQAVDAASGRLRWHRPSTRMLVLHNDELIAVGGNAGTTGPVPAAMRIHIGSGELIGYMAGSWNPDDAYLSAAGHSAEAYSIWSWGRHGLIRHNFDAVPFQTEITPYAAAIQDEHLYAVDSERLHIVTMDGEVIASRAHNRSMPVLIVHQHRIFLSDNDGTSTFAIEDLLPVDNVPYGSTAAIAASELLLIPGNHGTLAVHQLYHHVAWERTEPARAVMAAGGMVFILTGSEILAIDGESVPAPPTTEVQIYPAQPDGRNGYYRTEPRVRLRATDAVSTVAETRYRINEQRAYRQYQDEFVLRENGVVRLQYFSVDDEGYREVGRMLQIKIDTQAPKIDTRIHADSGRNGFFTGPVDIRFAVDPGSSGLDTAQLRVSCSDMYLPGETDTRQLRNSDVHRVTDDGIHYLQYEAADFAGNVTVEDHIIRIDSRVPEVHTDVDMQPWSTRITLSAQAGPSGVARIEYRVNDSGVEHYADVLQLETPGEYQIDTRAVSGAGIAGAWTTQTIQVQNWSPGSWIADLRFSTPRSGQEIIRNFTGETRLYAHHQTELLDNPPGQLTGADYIRTHSADRILSPQQELMSFRLLVDADVYILAYPDSRAEYPGFDEVFPGYHDARILKKTAPQGTRIHIPGSGSAERADLVFVQYRRDNDLVMYEPAVAEPLLSGGDLRLRAEFYQQEAGTGQNNDLIWLLQVAGEDQWRHIHTGQNGLAVLPQVARTTRAIVRVEQQNSRGKVVAFREREITIANHGRVVMEHPGPSGEVLAGELQALRFTAFDYRGEEVVPGRVAWKILARGHDNTAGSDEIVPLELDADSCFTVPSSPGLLRLYAELDIGQGIIHHEEFDFQTVEAFSPTVIPAEAVHSSGEEAASSYDAPGMSWQRDAEGRFRIYSGYGTFLVELAVVEEPDAVRKVNPRTHRRPMLLLHDAPRYPQFREGIWTLPVQDVDGVIQLQMPDWAQGFEVIIRRGGEE